MIRKIKEQKDKESLLAFVTSFCSMRNDTPEQSRERGRAFLEGCGGTADGVLRMAEETRPIYARTAKMLELPLDQFEKEFAVEAKKLDANPVFKTFFPAVSSMRHSQARADVRRALLATAFDVQLDGPEAVKNHVDPVAGGPFELSTFEGGFELRSKFKPADGKSWLLVVGRPRKMSDHHHFHPPRSSELTTQSTGQRFWESSTIVVAARSAMSRIDWRSVPAMCGHRITFGRPSSGLSGSGGSLLITSRPAPARWPDRRASRRSVSTTRPPRAVLIR